MEPVDRQQKFEAQTAEVYQAIGKCSVKFEHVTFTMQQAITFLLHKGGLKNQRLANVILADLTANPLKSIFQAMIPESSELSQEESNICDKIFFRTQKLIERRNDIIHSTWFVGWANPDDTDFSEVTGAKRARGKQGAVFKSLKHTAADFEAFARECDEVAELLHRLLACLIYDFKIIKNFVVSADGSVSTLSS